MQTMTSDTLLKKNLRDQIAEMETVLAIRKRMLALLQEDTEDEEPVRPRTRVWLLREYLKTFHPEGIAIGDVPTALREMGFITKETQSTTNWLRQQKPQYAFFVVEKGWVRLRHDLRHIDEQYGYSVDMQRADHIADDRQPESQK